MWIEVGHFLTCLALGLSLSQLWLGLSAGHAADRAQAGAANAAAIAAAVCLAAAFGMLMSAFLASDFSVKLVVENSHTQKPLIYKIAGVWGNHEGSMLLWCLVAAIYGAALAVFGKGMSPTLQARAVGVHGGLGAMTLLYVLVASNPFTRLAEVPFEGNDLNPLLQDPALAVHPPMLYAGYVGFSLVFSLAVAGLIEGKVDRAWAGWIRPWALAAFSLLTIGIGLGSWWAYYELGWGGWWFWDPVENASFMPWLAGAALIHAAAITEKRGTMVTWTILLALLAFILSLLGAFLVRSGVLTSVHAFAVDPQRGTWILSILMATAAIAFGLYAWRAPRFSAAKPAVFAIVSRDSALLINNLFVTVACGTVLIGTLYPLVVEAATGRSISVGPPYFNLTFTPLMAGAMALLPLAPFLAWKRGDLKLAVARLAWVGGLAVAFGAAALVFSGGRLLPALGLALGAWVLMGAVANVLVRYAMPAKVGIAARAGLVGMTLAHAGLGVFTLGAVAQTAFKVERSISMTPGQTVAFAGRNIRFESISEVEGSNYYADRARFVVTGQGSDAVLTSEKRFYPAARMPTSEVGIRPSYDGDLYVALGDRVRVGAAAAGAPVFTVRLYHNPMMYLIFWGVGMIAIGSALAMSQRRLLAEAAARAAPASGVPVNAATLTAATPS
jgi:cytochrome c-type biogenesis protein CcmF